MTDIDVLATSPWQMTFGERAALEGILSQLRPRLAIEIGTAEGGSLRRIAAHSEEIHSFDLVTPAYRVDDWGDVRLHTGDSHVLLPEVLAELAAAARNVDFVLVDGDHTADGVAADLNDLMASPATGHTVILIHDTLNDEVRRGVGRMDLEGEAKVVYHDLDFVGGHLSRGGDFHHELWGGMALIVTDDRPGAGRPRPASDGFLYDLFSLVAPARDALVAYEATGAAGPPPSLTVAGHEERLRAELYATREQLARARALLVELERSPSWRLTAPLRGLKRLALRLRRRWISSVAGD